MKAESDSAEPDFWSTRYASGRTPWQMDHVPARVELFVQSLSRPSSILIPGCGEDHRTLAAFMRAGHHVTAIDFSPVAVSYTTKALPELADQIILGDFFRHDFGPEKFDVIYERTFLCSLPPRLWKNYAVRAAQLLRPSGILAGIFFYGDEPDPPPFPLTEEKAAEILGDDFELRKSEPVTDSLPFFAGQEMWQEWQLRPSRS